MCAGTRPRPSATAGSSGYDAVKNRWYLDASWKTPQAPAPSLEELRQAPVLAADLNHGHLAAWIITPDGNPQGPPVTVPLELAGLPATQRDGRLRAAISELIRIARQHGCRAISVEDLDFNQARAEGRERHGNRPSRGNRGKAFRRVVAGIPTARFRDRLTQMTSNHGLAVIAVDPAYTSRWGAEHWLAPLREQNTVLTTGHHAAAVVIGRRAQGRKARRRAGVTRPRPEDHVVRAAPRAPRAKHADRESGTRQAPRQPPRWPKTVTADREHPPDQAAHDRSEPPDSQDHLLLSQLGTVPVCPPAACPPRAGAAARCPGPGSARTARYRFRPDLRACRADDPAAADEQHPELRHDLTLARAPLPGMVRAAYPGRDPLGA